MSGFSKRTLGITAVFHTIFIASAQGLQAYTINPDSYNNPATTSTLQGIYQNLTQLYQRLLNQNGFATSIVGPFIEGAGESYSGAVPPAPLDTLLQTAQTLIQSLVTAANSIPANAQPWAPFQSGVTQNGPALSSATFFVPQVPASTISLATLKAEAQAALSQIEVAVASPDDNG